MKMHEKMYVIIRDVQIKKPNTKFFNLKVNGWVDIIGFRRFVPTNSKMYSYVDPQ